jgi:hypothetical protein
MDKSFLKTADEVLAHFNVDPANGLTNAQVEANRKEFGTNGKSNTKTITETLFILYFQSCHQKSLLLYGK